MDFNSLLFLMVFLPIVLGIYWLAFKFENEKRILSRIVLLSGGIIFYVFNSSIFHLALIIALTAFHYLMCFLLYKSKNQPKRLYLPKLILIADIVISVSLLVFYKYFNLLPFENNVVFPLALSFITFQTISFVVDVYRNDVNFKRVSLLSYFLYIFLFMKLIEGPITPYNNLSANHLSLDKLFNGIVRFCFGMAKKVLIADTLAVVVTSSMPEINFVGTSISWLCIICFSLQLYFDFSGYCDMAIGVGLMFGYDLPENFNDPYLSTSIRDFWRRWHISLSNWFKKYVYIPLGGNRKGRARTILNLFIIFVLTGLWHGSTINFLLWGLYFGLFMIAERVLFGKLLDKCPIKFFNIIYSVFIVMMGWVLFICPTFSEIGFFYKNLFAPQENTSNLSILGLLSFKVIVALFVGIAFSTFIPYLLERFCPKRNENNVWIFSKAFIGITLLVLCIIVMTNNSYAPSLYGGF